MVKQHYSWKRLWVPGTGPAVDEVLTHPTYFATVAGAEPLENWQQISCLILLGEPGMGKSAEWTRQQQLVGAEASLKVNLGDFSSGRDIVDALVDEPAVRDWCRQPETGLWLWLDSFDEALLHEAKLAQALTRLLRQWPTTGLHLRILSRTATWPAFFTEALKAHFGHSDEQPQVVTLQLAPLTQVQVQEAAEVAGIETEAFIAAVERAEAVPLATLPVTLDLLFRLWKAGRFSVSTGRGIELLEEGCRLLCEEGWDEQRVRFGQVDADQRLRIAAQLALVMVACRRRALNYAALADEELWLRLRDVTGEPTLFQDKPGLVLEKELVDEVLRETGLFVSVGSQIRWIHPVFSDFLAAWALYKAQIGPAQLRNLFRSAVPGAGVVPALRDAAVWLASLSPTFAADLAHLDPLTAMRADVLTSGPGQRAALVAELFALTTARHQYPRRAEPYLARLAHPGLAGQLAAVLRDPAAGPEARWLAYKTAESCETRELIPLLLQQTLDAGLPTRVRTDAIRTLHRLAGPGDCQPLRPLLAALPPDDEDDEFRGVLLQLLWPAHMTVQELLALLTPRRKSSTIGAYHLFLDPAFEGGLQAGLAAAHLPALLRWLLRRSRLAGGPDQRVAEFVRNAVVSLAWQHTDDAQVLAWLALTLRHLLAGYEVPQVPAEAILRRRVVSRWVLRQQLPQSWELMQRHQVVLKLHGRQEGSRQSLVDLADFDFVLALLGATTHPPTVTNLFETALQLLNESFTEQSSHFQARFLALYTVAQARNLDAGRSWAWELNADTTNYWKNSHDEQQRLHQQRRRKARRARRWNSRTYRLLIRLTAPGNPRPARAWRYAHWLLTRSSDGHRDYLGTEMQAGFAWLRASALLHQRLVDLACRAVQAAPPQVAIGQLHNSFSEVQAIPLAALLLCQDERPQLIAAFSAAEWQPWLRALLFGWVGETRRTQLFGVALRQHRRAVLRQLGGEHDFWQQITTETYGYTRLNEVLREIPDELVWRRALQGVQAGQWSRDFSQQVLGQLLQLRFRSAELFRDSLFTPPTVLAWPILTYAAFYETLFDATPTVDWWATWQRLLSFGPELACTLVGRLQGQPTWTTPLPPDLPDEQLISLLHWVVQEQGVTEENEASDWQYSTPASRLRTFRDSVAKLLAGRATAPAWSALQDLAIAHEYPRWLTYTLEEARETYSRRNWEPLNPTQLQQFLRHAPNRWVQSSADLLDAVLESLDRLQQRLQGSPARAHDLWYPVDQKKGYRIVNGNKLREENSVTDYVQGFLDDDLHRHLFATHREVQLRAGAGTQKGQELDLYVEAVANQTTASSPLATKLLVFIEAKHQDNPEVKTALDQQLVNRYLRNHSATTGLFLVYWYRPGPDQKGKVNRLADLRQLLDQQAQQASANGRLVKSYVLDIRLPDDQS